MQSLESIIINQIDIKSQPKTINYDQIPVLTFPWNEPYYAKFPVFLDLLIRQKAPGVSAVVNKMVDLGVTTRWRLVVPSRTIVRW